jgi:hypothetical protein
MDDRPCDWNQAGGVVRSRLGRLVSLGIAMAMVVPAVGAAHLPLPEHMIRFADVVWGKMGRPAKELSYQAYVF